MAETNSITAVIHHRAIDAEGNVYEDGVKIGWQPPCTEHDVTPAGRCRRCHQAGLTYTAHSACSESDGGDR